MPCNIARILCYSAWLQPLSGSGYAPCYLNGCALQELLTYHSGVDGRAVFDHSDYGGGTPGSTRGSNGIVNGVNQSKSNGVSKHSKSVPHSYNHNLAILTPSDLLVSMHASAGSPRANGYSIS